MRSLARMLVLICSLHAFNAMAQVVLSETTVQSPGKVSYSVREIRVSDDLIVSLKHIRLSDGALMLRSIDQSEDDLQKLDLNCKKWGAIVSRSAEVSLSGETVTILPCVADMPKTKETGRLEGAAGLSVYPSADKSVCGAVSVLADLSGPGSMERNTSDMFVAEGIYEYDSGPGQVASLNGNALPSCWFGVSNGISRFGWALLPFSCTAAYPVGTYSGSATAEVCGETDTAYSSTTIF